MEIVTGREIGLFPSPKEIEMSCSCPDWAEMCKHVAATLYGIGSRLDLEPELLFNLRGGDHLELIAQAGSPVAKTNGTGRKTIATERLAGVFEIELEASAGLPAPARPGKTPVRRKSAPSIERQAKRIAEKKPKQAEPRDSGSVAQTENGTLSAQERKRIAQALKTRWEARRNASQSKNSTAMASPPAPVKRAAKAISDQSPKDTPRRCNGVRPTTVSSAVPRQNSVRAILGHLSTVKTTGKGQWA
jgi:uncharacterized Zn finger protein